MPEKIFDPSKTQNLINAVRELLANLSDADQDHDEKGEPFPDILAVREALDEIDPSAVRKALDQLDR